MQRKSVLVLVAVVLVCALIITGCTKTTPTTSAPTTSAPATTNQATTTTKPTTTTATTTAPSSTTPAPGTPKYGGTLTILSPTQPGGPFGWPLDMDGAAMPAQNYVLFEPLIRYFADDHVEPLLATSWELAEDKTSMTFHLRQDVKFHDGTDFNAEAAKLVFDSGMAQKTSQTAGWKSVDVVDTYTVRINFITYANNLWAQLCSKTNMMVSPKPFKELGMEEGKKYARQHPSGTGPFKFDAYLPDQYFKYVRNDNYWGKDAQGNQLPYLDKIEFLVVKDQNTIEAAFLSGTGQEIMTQQGRTLYTMKQQGYDVYSYAAGTSFLAPDSNLPGSPYADKRVREALEYAIDKNAIVNALGYGYMYVANQLINPPNPYFNPNIKGRDYDVAKAKALLAEAGITTLKTTLTTQAMFISETQLYQQMLSKVGINSEIVMLDNNQYFVQYSKGWKNLLVVSSSYQPNWASSYNQYFLPGGMFLQNSIKIPQEQIDLTKAAISTADPKEQKELIWKLVQAINDDCTFIPTFANAMGTVVNPVVKGGDWHIGVDYNAYRPDTMWLDD